MSKCKTFIENVADIRSNSSVRRESLLCRLMNIYYEEFNKQRAVFYFRELPVNLVFRDDKSFTLNGKKSGQIFKPKTIADFISICDSISYTLRINIQEGDSDEETNRLLAMY